MQQNKLKLIVLLLLSIWMTRLQAQEAISTSGGNASGTSGSASYTVGQIVYTTNSGSNGSVVQGVQQPFEISIITGLKETRGITLQYAVYPNPVSDYLTLKIEGDINTQYIASLYDTDGKLLENKKIESNETTISMDKLVPSTYFLKVTSDSKELKAFKIIKTQ